MAGPEPHADAGGGAPHPRGAPRARDADRDARCRRRAPADGRPREDDPGPARRRAPRQLLLNQKSNRRTAMSKFVIEPHFRLQEWVAHEKGYFTDEGLDYEFRELVQATDGKIHDKGVK